MSAHYLDLPTFGARLRFARERAGLTAQELARSLGKEARQTVGRWEAGKFEPSLEEIALLARTLKVDRNWLAFGDGVPFALPEVEAFLDTERGKRLPPEQAEILRRHSHSLFPTEHPTKAQIKVVLSLVAYLLRPTRQSQDGDTGDEEK